MQSTISSLKSIARLLVLAIAVLFYFVLTTPTHAQVGIPTGGVELDGYAWSSNIGWISMNCKTGGTTGNDICTTSNYKATVQTDGTVTGYAWSSNIGWIRFGGLSSFPTAAGTMAVNARMTGTYPDLTFEGWVRACAGDSMNASCNVVVSTSTAVNGIDWTYRGTTNQAFRQFNFGGAMYGETAVYGNGRFVALAGSGPTSGVLTSTNGISWSLSAIPAGDWLSLTYGNGRFVGITYTGTNRIMHSSDGLAWVAIPAPSGGANAWRSITFGNGLFVAVACGVGTTCNESAGNYVMTSPDGITWTSRTAPGKLWNSVTYGNGLFVAVSESAGLNNVMTSPDGITWTSRTAPATFWGKVVYGNGRFVAIPWTGGSNIITSSDGITWTTQIPQGLSSLQNIVFAYDKFVAINNGIFTSPDGVNWTSSGVSGPSVSGAVLAYGNNTVAVAETSFAAPFDLYTGVFSTYTGTGWDGWISLRSTTAPTHSVVMSSTGASATSYAWGSSVTGWINFDDVRFLAPTATLSGTNCSIPAGAATCNSSFTWNIQNATSPNLRNSTRSVTYTTNAAGTTTPYAIRQGANTVQARDNNTVLQSIVVNGTCAAGTDYANGSTCEVTTVPAPVITLTTNKSIARTGDTVQVSWTITPSPLASGTCNLSGGGLPASVTSSGSQTTTALKSKTNFTMVCTGAYGTVRANATVEIIPKASEV